MKKLKNNPSYKTLLFALVLSFIIITGVTIANLISQDSVTNSQSAYSLNIELLEPNWLSYGQKDAQKMVPGMVIDKDPYVLNNSKGSVYVRMKIVIKDSEGQKVNDDKYINIMRSLYYLENDEMKSLMTVDNDNISCNNPNFFYYNDWFYYGKSNDNEYTFTSLDANQSTPKLFDKIVVPIYRQTALGKEIDGMTIESWQIYEGLFDEPITIEVVAQGLSTEIEPSEVIETFNAQFQ